MGTYVPGRFRIQQNALQGVRNREGSHGEGENPQTQRQRVRLQEANSLEPFIQNDCAAFALELDTKDGKCNYVATANEFK